MQNDPETIFYQIRKKFGPSEISGALEFSKPKSKIEKIAKLAGFPSKFRRAQNVLGSSKLLFLESWEVEKVFCTFIEGHISKIGFSRAKTNFDQNRKSRHLKNRRPKVAVVGAG